MGRMWKSWRKELELLGGPPRGESCPQKAGTGLLGFEPRSEAPEASVLSKLDYRPSLAERSLRIKAFRGSYQERCDGEPDAAT